MALRRSRGQYSKDTESEKRRHTPQRQRRAKLFTHHVNAKTTKTKRCLQCHQPCDALVTLRCSLPLTLSQSQVICSPRSCLYRSHSSIHVASVETSNCEWQTTPLAIVAPGKQSVRFMVRSKADHRSHFSPAHLNIVSRCCVVTCVCDCAPSAK